MKRQLIRVAKPIVDRFPKLAMTYRYLRDNWHTSGVPEMSRLGFKLIGNQAMQAGTFEPDETELVKRILPSVDVFINVGANIGYYCCIALSHGKYVIAFEPVALNLRCLLKNIKANNWDSQAEVFPLALSNKVGVIELYGGGTGASLLKGWAGTPEQYVTLVPCSTIDNIVHLRSQNRRCFIFVDIEGAEPLMLEGAASILAQQPKPIWMMEICISEHQPNGVSINPNLLSTFQVFWNSGYEAWTANKQCRLVEADEIANIASTGHDTLHTHNFLFIERGRKHEFLGA